MDKLLTRTEFREECLKRDQWKCVNCANTENLAVHHIIERRLWIHPDEEGGYFMTNGASLCEKCHILAEQTVLSCDEIRFKSGINKIITPSNFYQDVEIDKWGNYIQPNGLRLRGELFYDESVQKILKEGNILNQFVDYVKYPRTYHFSFSNPSKDDKIINSYSAIVEEEVVVTLKLDGENTSMYHDYIHARSLDPLMGEDRGWVKALHSTIQYDIPKGWRICGENLYAQHSIRYEDLDSYFYVFSIWNEYNECLSWNNTIEWCQLLGLHMVPVLYRGKFDLEHIKSIVKDIDTNTQEGFVCRPTRAFNYSEFKNVMIKWVRENHVTSDRHWRHKKTIPNEIKPALIV